MRLERSRRRARTVTSADGTRIAYERIGEGPPLVVVTGPLNDRRMAAPLVSGLAGRSTAFVYDRRGRGNSGDTGPYAVAREIEDLGAMLEAAGGSATVLGYCSGAILALEAAAAGLPARALVLFEPAFLVGAGRPRPGPDLAGRIASLVAGKQRGDAVELYQREAIGLTDEEVEAIRDAPSRPALKALAHTLVYDATIVGDMTLPVAKLARIETPALLLDSELSRPSQRAAAAALAETLPRGSLVTLRPGPEARRAA